MMDKTTNPAHGDVTEPRLTFRGVRGSMPVSGSQTNRYGGHTLCIEASAGDGSVVLIDGGTGITSLHRGGAPNGPTNYHIFLTHYHWDHIQGLLFFPSPVRSRQHIHILRTPVGRHGLQRCH